MQVLEKCIILNIIVMYLVTSKHVEDKDKNALCIYNTCDM